MPNNLKFWRTKRGLTQEQLGNMIGLPQSNIATFEKRTYLLPKSIKMLSDALNVSAYELTQADYNNDYVNAWNILHKRNILNLMHHKNITIKELAYMCGISEKSLIDKCILTHDKRPDKRLLEKIALGLRVKPVELTTDLIDTSFVIDDITGYSERPDLKLLIPDIRAMSRYIGCNIVQLSLFIDNRVCMLSDLQISKLKKELDIFCELKDTSIVGNIRQLRFELGLTQEALALELNTYQQRLSRYENKNIKSDLIFNNKIESYFREQESIINSYYNLCYKFGCNSYTKVTNVSDT